MIGVLIQYILKAAYYDRLPFIFLLCILVALSGSIFMGGNALTEQDQFAVIFAANSLRLILVLLIIFYISHYFNRAYQKQEISAILTKPISRFHYLLAHYFAFQVIAFLFVLLSGAFFLLIFPLDINRFFYWVLGVWAELSIMALVAVFFSLLLSQGFASILASIGLYLLGRLSGTLLFIVETGNTINPLMKLSEILIQIISIFVPRFDLFIQSEWLLYEQSAFEIPVFLIFHFIIFSGLILSASAYDLIKKEF